MTTLLRQRTHEPDDPRDPPTEAVAREDARRLADLARESAAGIVGRRALLLRLSALPEDLARPHHRRLAHEALLPLIGADRARLFRLPNADMVVVWRGMAEAALQSCLATLRYLFADEPGQSSDALILLLELPGDAARLAAKAEASLLPRRAAPVRQPPRQSPLDPATLAALQAALAGASIDRFLRRQRIWEAGPDGFVPRWERRGLSIDEIGETMVPGRDLRADPWLLRCLTRTLDQRLLSLLAAPGELRGATPFSLDLNVASLLGPDFLRFDAALPSALRGTIMVALRPPDILADPAAFLFGRDFVRARGYRLALAGIDAARLAVFPLAALGLDKLLLRWSPALAEHTTILPDPDCIILCGTDDAAGLTWGRGKGIQLYEGRHIAPAMRSRG
jgi:hypothetical protein